MFGLPLAYRGKIESLPGVTRAAYGNWFGGYYQTETNFFAQFAVDDTYLDLYPEFLLTPEERTAFLSERTACVIGEKLARRFGWALGDRIVLQGTIYPGNWEFTIRGIFQGRDRMTDTTPMFFRWDYLNEWVEANYDLTESRVGWYVVEIDDPSAAAMVSESIDALFENSERQTRSETEKAFQLSFVSMAGAIVAAIETISFVVVVIVLLVMANTMMMAARERTPQFGVMKTVGFRIPHLVMVIGGEALLIAFLGAALGVALSYPMVNFFGAFLEMNIGSIFPVFELQATTVAQAVVLCLLCGLLSALFPLISAIRTPIATAVRRVN
jgi:putative ABC transport system permease protein